MIQSVKLAGFAFVVLVLLGNGVCFAALSNTISYQGRLTNSSGQPLNGIHQIKFGIYLDSASVLPNWQETQQVNCVDGLFNVILGATTAFPNVLFGDYDLFLGITVGSDPELTPRRQLTASMFALRVKTVDEAQGGSIRGRLNAFNSVDGQIAMMGVGGRMGGSFTANEVNSSSVGVDGVIGNVVSPVDAIGVRGFSVTGDGWGIGGSFKGGYFGVEATAYIPDNSIGTHFGVISFATGYAGDGVNYGVYGAGGGGFYNYGVSGYAYHDGTPGAYAYGVYGAAQFDDGYGAWAGYFDGWTTCNGTLEVMGTLLKPAGSFRIDHPLDPENKFLQHSFVESPDMKNIYDGNIVTDKNGDATVTMPEWFDALNRDFRYQLTAIGQFAQAIVFEEIRDGRFSIKTDKPNVKVSWQVTGIRQDAYANAHRIQIEVDKDSHQRGRYIDPVAFGKPQELQLHYEMNKAAEDQRKAEDERMAKNRSERELKPVKQ